jgi:hypothetical protein
MRSLFLCLRESGVVVVDVQDVGEGSATRASEARTEIDGTEAPLLGMQQGLRTSVSSQRARLNRPSVCPPLHR